LDDKASVLRPYELTTNPDVHQNVIPHTHVFNYVDSRRVAALYSPSEKNTEHLAKRSEWLSTEVARIFDALNLEPYHIGLHRLKVPLFNKLMTCICDDLAQARNELAETMMRKAGYWRYVNRKTYNAMVANNEVSIKALSEHLQQTITAHRSLIGRPEED
ncbi:hypothetical protein LTR60_002637, partial [Cryomyces antarcticus]